MKVKSERNKHWIKATKLETSFGRNKTKFRKTKQLRENGQI